DHRLVRLPLIVAAEEQPAVRTEVVVHLQHHLEVAVLLLGNEDAAVARNVLASDDYAFFDHPSTARFVLARPAVPGLGARLPALQRLAVEVRPDPLVFARIGFFLPLAGIKAQKDERGRSRQQREADDPAHGWSPGENGCQEAPLPRPLPETER